MKKIIHIIIWLSILTPAVAQPQGKPLTEIFADFHYYNTKDTSSTTRTGFGLNRAFLGYVYKPSGNITATLIVNVGNPTEGGQDAKERRNAHFREAHVDWTNNKLTLSFGMTPTRSLNFQQKFYGKRYIADNFEAINGFSTVSDLGFSADYIINERFKVDFTLMNGEGYNNLHMDNSLKASFGINIVPTEKGIIRLYSDFDRPSGVLQQLHIAFMGYKTEAFSIGGEVAYKTNSDKIRGHDSWGFSATGSIRTSGKTELFGRYDYSTSNAADEDLMTWSYLYDRQFIVAGFQYTFNEYFRMALDYQGNYPNYNGLEHSDALYLNLHFRF